MSKPTISVGASLIASTLAAAACADTIRFDTDAVYTRSGQRTTIEYVEAPVVSGAWHTSRVEFGGRHIRVSLDGKLHIDLQDTHIEGAGIVGRGPRPTA